MRRDEVRMRKSTDSRRVAPFPSNSSSSDDDDDDDEDEHRVHHVELEHDRGHGMHIQYYSLKKNQIKQTNLHLTPQRMNTPLPGPLV